MSEPSGRETGWVVAQFVLIAIVIAAGFVTPDWPSDLQPALSVAGAILAVAGCVFAVWAGRTLGRSLTPFPKPVAAGLVTRGPFAIVRHPIYTGGLGLFVGYSLLTSVAALALTGGLALLWAGRSGSRSVSSQTCTTGMTPTRRRCVGASSRSSIDPTYNRRVSWPDPVERVAVFLRAAGAESRLEELATDTSSAQSAARPSAARSTRS